MISIRLACAHDLDGFLELAREVEPLFGPMVGNPEFVAAVRSAIAEECMVCAVDTTTGAVAGGCVISPESREIAWLAVSGEYRGMGAGGLLLAAALERLGECGAVRVTTFGADADEGVPARKLYERFGFVEVSEGPQNPAGYSTVVLERAG